MKDMFEKVLNYFNGNYEKTLIWFSTANPLLGDISPIWMIIVGRTEKLRKFIYNQLEGNVP